MWVFIAFSSHSTLRASRALCSVLAPLVVAYEEFFIDYLIYD